MPTVGRSRQESISENCSISPSMLILARIRAIKEDSSIYTYRDSTLGMCVCLGVLVRSALYELVAYYKMPDYPQ